MTVALSLIAAVAWTMANYWLVPLSRSVDPYVASLLILVGNGLCTIPLGLALDGLPSSDKLGPLGYALAAGVLEVCGFLFFFRALEKGDLAVVAPIIGLEGGIAALTVFAFGERVSAIVVLGLAIALLGGCLAASAGGRRTAAGALPAAGAAVCFGAMFALYAAAEDLGPVSVVGAGRLSALALLGVLVLWRRRAPAGPRRQRAPALARRARRHGLRLLLVRRLARPRERRGRGGGAVLDAQRGGRDRAPARAAPAASVRGHRPRRDRDGAARAWAVTSQARGRERALPDLPERRSQPAPDDRPAALLVVHVPAVVDHGQHACARAAPERVPRSKPTSRTVRCGIFAGCQYWNERCPETGVGRPAAGP